MAAMASTMGTARVVGTCVDVSFVIVEHIVLLAASQGHVVEAFTIGKSFHGIDAEHCMTKGCMMLSESWLTQSHGTSLDNTGHNTADGIAFGLHLLDESGHFFCFHRVGATYIVCFNQVEVIFMVCLFQLDIAHLRGIGSDADTELLQSQFGQSTAHNTRNGLASR